MVFPMADRILTKADQKELIEKFSEVDRSVGLEVIARLERFAKGLAPAATQSSASNTTPSDGCACGCPT